MSAKGFYSSIGMPGLAKYDVLIAGLVVLGFYHYARKRKYITCNTQTGCTTHETSEGPRAFRRPGRPT